MGLYSWFFIDILASFKYYVLFLSSGKRLVNAHFYTMGKNDTKQDKTKQNVTKVYVAATIQLKVEIHNLT